MSSFYRSKRSNVLEFWLLADMDFDYKARLRAQQPCSNPSKQPEWSGTASKRKFGYLQGLCKLWKTRGKY
jgi:hypothetical protein